jgi:L-ribulose-5-phosphate 3-epimerase
VGVIRSLRGNVILSRRLFSAALTSAALRPEATARSAKPAGIGVLDGSLGKASTAEAVVLAATLGFDGVQISTGKPGADGRLPLASRALQERILQAAAKWKMPVISICLDALHVNCLKNDDQAKVWVRDAIEMTRRLGAPILMPVFFHQCAIAGRSEVDAVARAVKGLASVAADAGIVLGLENTVSASDNVRLLELIGSPWVKIFYDVGNAVNLMGVDPAREIRKLGKERICQMHLKDRPYLGQGKVNFQQVAEAVRAVGFGGYVTLETPSPSGDVESDMRRNLDYARRSFRSSHHCNCRRLTPQIRDTSLLM